MNDLSDLSRSDESDPDQDQIRLGQIRSDQSTSDLVPTREESSEDPNTIP